MSLLCCGGNKVKPCSRQFKESEIVIRNQDSSRPDIKFGFGAKLRTYEEYETAFKQHVFTDVTPGGVAAQISIKNGDEIMLIDEKRPMFAPQQTHGSVMEYFSKIKVQDDFNSLQRVQRAVTLLKGKQLSTVTIKAAHPQVSNKRDYRKLAFCVELSNEGECLNSILWSKHKYETSDQRYLKKLEDDSLSVEPLQHTGPNPAHEFWKFSCCNFKDSDLECKVALCDSSKELFIAEGSDGKIVLKNIESAECFLYADSDDKAIFKFTSLDGYLAYDNDKHEVTWQKKNISGQNVQSI